jgi:hypothetical protein
LPFGALNPNQKMKKNLVLLCACAALVSASASHAAVIDDFSGAFSASTVVVLDNSNTSVQNTASFSTSGGVLTYTTTTFDAIQQTLSTYSGQSLTVGQELQLSITSGGVASGGSQDIGIFVGGVSPTFNVRSTYVNIYVRANGQLYSRGFNGSTELALSGGTAIVLDSIFIARTATNDYELGYYVGSTRTVLTTRTGLTNNDASYLGIYTDVRAVGTLRSVDNLTIIPEPSAALLGGLGALGLLRRRRR